MRKPSVLPLLLTPALFAFASTAYAVATASSSSPAPAPATSSSFSGMTAESLATSPRSTTPSGTASAASPSTTTGSNASGTSSNASSANGSSSAGGGVSPLDASGIPNQAAIGPTANPSPFAPGSTFSTDNGNPELGTSPGQTSPGTAVGNEPSGLDVGTGTLDANGNFNGVPAGAGGVAPVDVIGGVGGGGGVAGAPGAGGTAIAVAPGRTLANGGSATPLLDQATRDAEQRLARERATGRTPRVIGIAPRTDEDRTDQMPDDPIIRY